MHILERFEQLLNQQDGATNRSEILLAAVQSTIEQALDDIDELVAEELGIEGFSIDHLCVSWEDPHLAYDNIVNQVTQGLH